MEHQAEYKYIRTEEIVGSRLISLNIVAEYFCIRVLDRFPVTAEDPVVGKIQTMFHHIPVPIQSDPTPFQPPRPRRVYNRSRLTTVQAVPGQHTVAMIAYPPGSVRQLEPHGLTYKCTSNPCEIVLWEMRRQDLRQLKVGDAFGTRVDSHGILRPTWKKRHTFAILHTVDSPFIMTNLCDTLPPRRGFCITCNPIENFDTHSWCNEFDEDCNSEPESSESASSQESSSESDKDTIVVKGKKAKKPKKKKKRKNKTKSLQRDLPAASSANDVTHSPIIVQRSGTPPPPANAVACHIAFQWKEIHHV